VDSTTRLNERDAATGDPEAAARALHDRVRCMDTRDLSGPWDCPHCDRRGVYALTVACTDGLPQHTTARATAHMSHVGCGCNGTGRTTWPWEGDTGRLALAAYAGDPAARELHGGCPFSKGHVVEAGMLHSPPLTGAKAGHPKYAEACPGCHPNASLGSWLAGLSRWPGAPLIAALGAAWAWLPRWEAPRPMGETFPNMPPGEIADRLVDSRHLCSACGGEDPECVNVCATYWAPRRALTAATEHARCGCEASRGACENDHRAGSGLDHPFWDVLREASYCSGRGIPGSYSGDAISYIADPSRLGEPATRAAVQAALVGRALRGEVGQ